MMIQNVKQQHHHSKTVISVVFVPMMMIAFLVVMMQLQPLYNVMNILPTVTSFQLVLPNTNQRYKKPTTVPYIRKNDETKTFLMDSRLRNSRSELYVQRKDQTHTGDNKYEKGKKTTLRQQQQEEQGSDETKTKWLKQWKQTIQSTVFALSIGFSALTFNGVVGTGMPAYAATTADSGDSLAIVKCLFSKCTTELARCIADPRCLANVVCINTCTGRPDEIDCQIKCGDILDSPVIADFNKCVISEKACVPQKPDEGLYPLLTPDQVVSTFNTNTFNGRWYITAGQNKLFDIFPCQVHFFTETSPGKFFGKLNWRVTEPDGEFFTRDALQEFIQDPKDPSHLINHDNEYLHYKDDWYIIDYEYDNNKDNIPPFVFVYYRGSNDAWDGYGGVVIYTRAAQLPEELLPRLRIAANKIHYNFDTDFEITDNTCPGELSDNEKLILREKFIANKVVLQTQQQIAAATTKVRGNAVNSIKAQKLFFENRLPEVNSAYQILNDNTKTFEKEQTTTTTTVPTNTQQ